MVELKIIYSELKKETRYRTLNPEDCSHIIAKLRFLLQGQNMSKNQRRMPA